MPKFGYYECRAQLQRSPGVWGAFWLQSPKRSDGLNLFYIDGLKFYEVMDGVSHIEGYIILSMELPNDKKEMRKQALQTYLLLIM
ncbi:MAG: hypothetical protein CK547_05895 [Chitinophagaceae bacterium]|nr:MAG: hypothetical protein CK547_05895 [Chitinophagaceae bacterium]